MEENVRSEILRVQKLLSGPLKKREKAELEAQLSALNRQQAQQQAEKNRQKSSSKRRPAPPLPGSPLSLTWGRPAVIEGDLAEPKPDPASASSSPTVAEPPALLAQPAPVEPEPEPADPAADPAVVEDLVAEVKATVDHVLFLKAVWATSLSQDVGRQIEAWLRKLQNLASKLRALAGNELVEETMAGHVYLLSSLVRNLSRYIPQQLQESILPPSVPNSATPWNADVYWMIREPRRTPEPERPAGYVADGLQNLVA